MTWHNDSNLGLDLWLSRGLCRLHEFFTSASTPGASGAPCMELGSAATTDPVPRLVVTAVMFRAGARRRPVWGPSVAPGTCAWQPRSRKSQRVDRRAVRTIQSLDHVPAERPVQTDMWTGLVPHD